MLVYPLLLLLQSNIEMAGFAVIEAKSRNTINTGREYVMGMRLIAGAVLLSLGIFTFALCYLEARNPKPPFWAKDTIMDSFLVPLIVSCITTGPMLVIQVLAMHYTEITSKDM